MSFFSHCELAALLTKLHRSPCIVGHSPKRLDCDLREGRRIMFQKFRVVCDLKHISPHLHESTYHISPLLKSWSKYEVKTGVLALTLCHDELLTCGRVQADDPAVEVVRSVQSHFEQGARSTSGDVR